MLTLFKNRVVENCCVLDILCECLTMMIQHESKHAAISNDIFLEIQLCLTEAVYLYFASTLYTT